MVARAPQQLELAPTAPAGMLDRAVAAWPRVEGWLFPVVPSSPSGFVSFLFWHSLLLTASTPLARVMTGQWMGIFTIESVLSRLGLSSAVAAYPGAYLVYPMDPDLDRGFAWHALFGMLWLVVAYVQMGPLARRWPSLHRRFGKVSALALVLHLGAALSLLITDTQGHHWLPIVILLSPVIRSATHLVKGIRAVISGDREGHVDHMMRCFIYSIEGAGTIRTVGYVLWLAELGPTVCQAANGVTATSCVGPYVLQLVCIRLLSLYWIGCFTRMRGRSGLTRAYVKELAWTLPALAGAASYAHFVVG